MSSRRTPSLSRWFGGVPVLLIALVAMAGSAWAQTPVPMLTSSPYVENFADIANWTNNFAAGNGANRYGSVAINATGTIPDGARTTSSTATFATGSGTGVQRGTGNIQLLPAGTTDNTTAIAVDLYLDFTGTTAGTLTFDWAEVNNSTGDRKASLRVYTSTNGTTWTELAAAAVLNYTNNVSTSGQITAVALPAAFDGSSTARIRFYNYNGTGGTTGSRPKISIDNLTVTATAAAPAAPVATAGTGITSSGFTANWGSVSGATSYRLDVATDAGFTSMVAGFNDLTVAGTSQAVTGLAPSTSYFYRSRAVNGSGTSGNSNTITVTTAGALASEPTVAASSVSFSAVGSTGMTVSWTNGDGASRIVVARSGSAVTGTPSDGSTYAANAAFGSGATIAAGEFVVFNGSGSSVAVTGLTPSTTYHVAVFELNGSGGTENYLTTGPGTGSQATTVATYTWNAVGSASWATAGNWTPSRITPTTSDVLQFTAGGSVTATSVPTETIGQLLVASGSTVSLQAGAASAVLTIAGGSGTDLSVDAGCALNVNGANSLKFLVATGATGSVAGSVTFSNAAHQLDAADASGVTFQSGASLTQGTGATGNVFTNAGTANAIVFAGGSTLTQLAGSNPFGLTQPASKVVFQSGSNFSLQFNTTPSMSGRTYANFELNASGATVSVTGGNPLSMEDLTVTAGTLNLGMTGTFNLKGNVAVAGGATLHFNPASAATVTLSGTSAQAVSGAGALTIDANETLDVTNSAGVQLQRSVTTAGDVSVTGGALTVSAGGFTLTCGRDASTNAVGSLHVGAASTLSVGRHLTVNGVYTSGGGLTFAGTGTWTNPAGTQSFGDVTISPAITVTAGSTLHASSLSVSGALDPAGQTLIVSGNSDLNAGGDVSLASASLLRTGSLRAFGGTVTGSAGTVELTGTLGQLGGTSALSVGRLTINPGASATMAGDVSVTSLLTLSGGNITTGANTLSIVAPGTVTRSSGGVAGTLRKHVATGTPTVTFELAAGSSYEPVDVIPASVTTAGEVTLSLSGALHSQIATAGLASGRRWGHTLSLSPGAMVVAGATRLDLTLDPAAFEGSAAPTTFVARAYNGSVWGQTTRLAATGTSHSAELTLGAGSTELALGNAGIDHYVVTASSPQTTGVTFTTSVAAEDQFNQPVTDDNTTAVTMGSNGAVAYDSNGDATFGDNVKTLTAGALAIDTRDNTAETVTLTASDANGKTGSRTGLVIVAPLEITTISLANATAGVPYSQTVAATGGTAPYTFSIDTGSLPAGLAITPSTGEISGTANTAGTSNFTVKVVDSGTGQDTQALAITVVPAGAANVTFDVQPSNAAAGATITPAVQVKVTDAFSNPIPTELVSLSLVGSGTLSGYAPTATDGSGIAEFPTLSVDLAGSKQLSASTSGAGPTLSTNFTISAGAAANLTFDVQPTDAAVGAVITPAVKVKVTDALNNPIETELVSLSLVGSGSLNGYAPTATDGGGIATFPTLSVDFSGTGKRLSATTTSLGPVLSDPFDITCPAISLSPASLPNGTDGTPYSQTVVASGGVSPYSYAVTAGTLPGGLTLTAGTGDLSGTPTAPGTFNFTVTATDAAGCEGLRAYSLVIDVGCPAITVLPASLPNGSISVAYSQSLSASAGTPPFTFAVTVGSLPPGLTLTPAGLLSGTPTTAGPFSFTVEVTDANACTGSTAYTLTILGIPTAVTNLAAQQVRTGNDADGTTRITVSFTMPSGATVAEVYRAGFGHYPKYDDAGGVIPTTPAYPPSSPWTLTAVTATGQTDEPAQRDAYHYVVFVKNAAGGVSAVSNKTNGVLNYHLGDASNGITPGQGNNSVGAEDISQLGSNYGITEPEITTRGVAFLDVGPTIDLVVTSRPAVDNRIDFEDLIVNAVNYQVVSAPNLAAGRAGARPAGATPAAGAGTSGGAEEFRLVAPSLVTAGETVTATVWLKGGGRLQGFTLALGWDETVVVAEGMESGQWVESQGGVVLSPGPGRVDAALLGVRGAGMEGEGVVARVRFRALRGGDAGIVLAHAEGRDAANRRLGEGELGVRVEAARPGWTVLLGPKPNPMRSGEGTELEFGLGEGGAVELMIYGVDGRRVRTLVQETREAGMYRERWDGRDDGGHGSPSGVYYARLLANG
ncbi:MAG TPA: putative Ig domain-containing protein, partial [Candidatus Eisenbacteria bacterium]|nr:putative Ig domain-containing protein [Candidatus Eisenbacteria bacterium]